MAISFSKDDGPVAETVEETDSLVSDDDDEATTVGSETSMSMYDLVSNALPPYCFFGIEECRALFVQSSDKGKFDRVCGGSLPCNRHGHGTAEKAKHGHYAPVKARKYCDGKAHLPDAGGIRGLRSPAQGSEGVGIPSDVSV
jgi:hypothetical protein